MTSPNAPTLAVPAPPCTQVIFGAAGDLTRRLLLPSLLNLRRDRLLPDHFAIVGVARAANDDAGFREDVGAALREFGTGEVDPADVRWLQERCVYVRGDFTDPGLYTRLNATLTHLAETSGTGGNYLFYLATPPEAFATIVTGLGASGLATQAGSAWRRVVIEKPFGSDLKTAQALNKSLLAVLAEDQIYRIDHYLGKENVQNILALRFANAMFEPIWNRSHVDHVEITVAELVNVERRGKFYDATGALRDMVPNHLFQLLALTAMEPPSCFDADALRTERTKVLTAIHRLRPDEIAANVVRAQYAAGTVGGKDVVPYRQAPDVAPHSQTETFIALKVLIDNWRWADVPFYLRTGKALSHRRTEVAIHFRKAPASLFRNAKMAEMIANELVLDVQPEEGATLRFSAKVPGPEIQLGQVAMRFNYRDYFQSVPNTGYETLIYDCMIGDSSLFQSAENIEEGWRVVQPILDAWAQESSALPEYVAGTEGPSAADDLLARDGRHWRKLAR